MSAFLTAYIVAALWSSTDDDGNPLDRDHDASNVHPDTLARMTADCEAFVAAHGVPEYNDPQYSDDEKAGHDFWLSRNGHGAGFFDREIDDARAWQDKARAFGTFDLYVGDDGMIHGS